jgi:hypothetical protein
MSQSRPNRIFIHAKDNGDCFEFDEYGRGFWCN